ncbi:MAG: hypothetical protein LBV57_04440, partial [Candidatus Symbiothrix sp.]|nr:hypothetical protein [Candidatus Symbiothrix sp.]
MKIAFVLTVHLPDDERVWFQESSSLQKAGHEIFVVSSRTTQTSLPHSFCFDDTGMPKKELIATLASSLMVFSPDVIICDNPMAILAAQQFKRQKNKKAHIVYDVTEWYPSQKNLKNLPLFKKIIKAGLLTAFSYYAAWFLDGFIFGEYYKA